MTDRLSLYNGALRMLGERRLASLSENRQPRRDLDEAWAGGAVDYCLEAGQWKFAIRSAAIDYSPSVAPSTDLNFRYAFDKPADCKRLVGVYSDGTMTQPHRDYREEAGFWLSNQERLFVRFVSNDPMYGNDLSLWPARFVKFVEAHLAAETALSIKGDRASMEDMLSLRDKKFLPDALSNDAMQDPSKSLPTGSWVQARFGGGSYRRSGQP